MKRHTFIRPHAIAPDPQARDLWRMLQTDAHTHPYDPAPRPKSRDDQEARP